jgi:hypothetical protein
VIIQRRGDALVFIRQPDHAALAAELMAHWRLGNLTDHPDRDAILTATRHHDDGWEEEDDTLHVSEAGEPLDFVAVAPHVKQRIWPRAVERLAATSIHAAALVAQHALTIYATLTHDPEWRTFFPRMTRLRDDLRARLPPAQGADLTAAYAFVRIGDQLSLVFCNGWTAPMAGIGYRAILRGNRLDITPDPFGGQRVPIRIAARAIDARIYADAADLRNAYRAAAPVWLDGEAIGT